ncbi:MAG TPA: DUF6328 family protein [Gaiellaceae bacterium]
MLEDDATTLHTELGELLNAIRVALPGVQVLFAFLLVVPFSQRFHRVSSAQEGAYFGALLCAATASVLLIAPSAHHRLRWRRPVEERSIRWGNRLLILGTLFLAFATVGAVFFITDVLFGPRASIPVATALGAACLGLWYALPLAWSRRGEHARRG